MAPLPSPSPFSCCCSAVTVVLAVFTPVTWRGAEILEKQITSIGGLLFCTLLYKTQTQDQSPFLLLMLILMLMLMLLLLPFDFALRHLALPTVPFHLHLMLLLFKICLGASATTVDCLPLPEDHTPSFVKILLSPVLPFSLAAILMLMLSVLHLLPRARF